MDSITVYAVCKASLLLTKEESNEDKVLGLKQLADLITSEKNRYLLFCLPGVTEAFVQAVASGETEEMKESAAEGLYKFSRSQNSKVQMYETPGFVQALSAAAKNEHVGTKSYGLMGLGCLSMASENAARMFDIPGVVDALIQAAATGETNGIKHAGIVGLYNLSTAVENTVRMFETPGVIDALMQAIRTNETNLVHVALKALGNLCSCSAIIMRLVQTTGMVRAFINVATDGATDAIKNDAFVILRILSTFLPVMDELVSEYGILDTLLTLENRSLDVARIYLNLSYAPKPRRTMSQNQAVIDRLAEIARSPGVQTPLVARLTLAILAGADAKLAEFLKVEEMTLRQIVKVFEASLRDAEVFGQQWTTATVVLALRYLTTVPENRKLLGTKWLTLIPVVIENNTGLDTDPATANAAVACVMHYARADLRGTPFEVIVETADRWVNLRGIHSLGAIKQVIISAESLLPDVSLNVSPRVRGEIIKICQGFNAEYDTTIRQ